MCLGKEAVTKVSTHTEVPGALGVSQISEGLLTGMDPAPPAFLGKNNLTLFRAIRVCIAWLGYAEVCRFWGDETQIKVPKWVSGRLSLLNKGNKIHLAPHCFRSCLEHCSMETPWLKFSSHWEAIREDITNTLSLVKKALFSSVFDYNMQDDATDPVTPAVELPASRRLLLYWEVNAH